MSTVRVLLIAVALVTASLAVGLSAFGSCIQQTVAEQAGRADAIVYARVAGLEGPRVGASRIALVEVERVLKGSAAARIGVALGPGAEGGPGAPAATSIDYTVQRGEDHTFYLNGNAPAGYSTDACSGSHKGPPSADETAMFGPGRAPDPVPGGIGGASDSDRAIAGLAALVALAAGVAAIVYARRSARRTPST